MNRKNTLFGLLLALILLIAVILYRVYYIKTNNVVTSPINAVNTSGGDRTGAQQSPSYRELDLIRELLNTKSFYTKTNEINKILSQFHYNRGEMESHLSKADNSLGLFFPEKNIYCFAGTGQTSFNYKLYDLFMRGELVKNLDFFGRYKIEINNYLTSSQDDSVDSDIGLILKNLDKNNALLLKLEESNNAVQFKKKIFEINEGGHNDDVLSILFFQKNNLDKERLSLFLNNCFDYKTKSINISAVKEMIYILSPK